MTKSQDRDQEHPFAFTSVAWQTLNPVVLMLTQSFRQCDRGFVEILNGLRMGRVSRQALDMLQACKLRKFPADGIEPTQLYSRNVDVDSENQAQLAKLTTPEHTFRAIDTGGNPDELKKFKVHWTAPEVLRLKVGAQVRRDWLGRWTACS